MAMSDSHRVAERIQIDNKIPCSDRFAKKDWRARERCPLQDHWSEHLVPQVSRQASLEKVPFAFGCKRTSSTARPLLDTKSRTFICVQPLAKAFSLAKPWR